MAKFYLKIRFRSGVEYSWKLNRVPERISLFDLRCGQHYGVVQFWGVPKKEVSLKITGCESETRSEPPYYFKVSENLRDGNIGGIMWGSGSSYIAEPTFPENEEFDIIVQLRNETGIHNLVHIRDFDRKTFDGYDSIEGLIKVENSGYANQAYQRCGVSNETHTLIYDQDRWVLAERS